MRALRRAGGRLLDASIYWSFDRSGYERHAEDFDAADLDVDLAGRRCLVTGANSGIGRATAAALARRGAEVVLLCRDPARGEAAARSLRGEVGGGRVDLEVVDVSDLDSVSAAAERLLAGGAPVHVLVHNAGVLPAERRLTEAGHELTFATHVAGPLRLTALLGGALADADDARLIFVSSGGMYTQRLSLQDLDWARRPYDGAVAYAQTKRMQVVLAELLHERMAALGVTVDSMHPGWAETPAVRTSLPRFHERMQGRLRTAEQGADTVVWLACAPRGTEQGGRFWFDRGARTPWLLPRTREDAATREAFWALALAAAGLDGWPQEHRGG